MPMADTDSLDDRLYYHRQLERYDHQQQQQQPIYSNILGIFSQKVVSE